MVCRIDYIPKDFDDYCAPNLYGESKVIGELPYSLQEGVTMTASWMKKN